ncbi:TIMELESS-interacting protein [Halictus rubicundus]|uniref:TIMELESS-interacting protein n=1 Tax=Halictus rubicundus TaxID=77578 RepID=UPI00403572B5
MPALSNTSDYDDQDNIIAEYERRDTGAEQDIENRDVGFKNEEEEQGENTARRVDPSTSKRTTAWRTVPKLDTERLKGPKGIQTIEKYFEGFKFHGKGQEKLDLDRILKRMEHWAHRLFPKLEFDSFLERVENLASKRDLQVFITKYREDMISPDDNVMCQDIIDDDNEKEQDEPIDEFDLLIAEQIEKQKQVNQQSSDTSTADALFDKLMSETNSKASQQSQPVKENAGPSQLSDEVKERIERNRQQALKRREARLKAMEEEAKRKKLGESNDTESKNSCSNAQILSDIPSLKIKDSHKVENEKEENHEI